MSSATTKLPISLVVGAITAAYYFFISQASQASSDDPGDPLLPIIQELKAADKQVPDQVAAMYRDEACKDAPHPPGANTWRTIAPREKSSVSQKWIDLTLYNVAGASGADYWVLAKIEGQGVEAVSKVQRTSGLGAVVLAYPVQGTEDAAAWHL